MGSGSCSWNSLREVVLGLVGQPVGETAAGFPHGAMLTPGVCQGGKTGLVFGRFSCILGSCSLY